MVPTAEGWLELAIGVLGAIIGWAAKHFSGNRNN